MLEDVSSRAWLRRARAQKCIARCCGAKLQLPVFAPEGGARKRVTGRRHMCMQCGCSSESHSPLAVLSEGPLRAGCPRVSGSQRQPCGGCAQLSGVGKCRLAHWVSGLGFTTIYWKIKWTRTRKLGF